jgi:predicted secreted hydrolase
LDASAVGWDWIGINLQDGGALTAFQLRNAQGAAVWAGGSVRSHGQGSPQLQVFGPGDVAFRPLRVWRSAKGTPYPVEWSVRTPQQSYTVRAVVDNQELDSSTSTGAIYWEGLSELRDSAGRLVGRGYLEMTGYAAPLRI